MDSQNNHLNRVSINELVKSSLAPYSTRQCLRRDTMHVRGHPDDGHKHIMCNWLDSLLRHWVCQLGLESALKAEIKAKAVTDGYRFKIE